MKLKPINYAIFMLAIISIREIFLSIEGIKSTINPITVAMSGK